MTAAARAPGDRLLRAANGAAPPPADTVVPLYAARQHIYQKEVQGP